MKQTGIIMSGDHPRKILDGTKTLTRRTSGLEGVNTKPDDWELIGLNASGLWEFSNRHIDLGVRCKCPYGQVGDRLWVRETWAVSRLYNNLAPRLIDKDATVLYFADGKEKSYWIGRTRPSIFMPRWASRITLEITEVRVERLQEISDEDAIAEGIERHTDSGNNIFWFEVASDYHGSTQSVTAIEAFGKLWDSLNAKRGYSWESNPWVWVINFKEMPC